MGDTNPEVKGPNNLFATTHQITMTPTVDGSPAADQTVAPSPASVEESPSGGSVEQLNDQAATSASDEIDEEVVWEARYSLKNFVGRITMRAVFTLAWIALAVTTWGYGRQDLMPLTTGFGLLLGVLWLVLFYRILQARYGHYYRLTTRRLFVSTGLMRRRRDQMELLRVKDVFTRQTLTERWLSLGSVVVVSTEKELPVFYLTGVDHPKAVMDLVWNQARAERDRRSTKIDSV